MGTEGIYDRSHEKQQHRSGIKGNSFKVATSLESHGK